MSLYDITKEGDALCYVVSFHGFRILYSLRQECADLPRSITKLLPKFPLPHGYKMASGPLVFFGKQWARFYHIPVSRAPCTHVVRLLVH